MTEADDSDGSTQPPLSLTRRRHRTTQASVLDSEVPSHIPTDERGQTDFDPNDVAKSKRERYKRWRKLNDTWRSDDGKSKRHDGGIKRDIGVICSTLECTDRQQERATWLAENIDIQTDLSRQMALEAALLGMVVLACREDRRRVRNEDAFDEIRTDLDVSSAAVDRAIRKVRDTDAYTSPKHC